MTGTPRVIAVGRGRSWDARTNGGTIRQRQMLLALGAIAPVHYVDLDEPHSPDGGRGPLPPGVADVTTIPLAAPARSSGAARRLARRVGTLLRFAPQPPPITIVSAAPDARDSLRVQLAGADLVWFCNIEAATAVISVLQELPTCATAMDLYDLESERFRQRLGLERDAPATVRRLRSGFFLRGQARAWDRWTRDLVGRLDETFVTKSADALHLRAPKVTVVPNGTVIARRVPGPGGAPGRQGARRAILFVGTLKYAPNVRGIRWFLDEVAPEIRRTLAVDPEIRIVGELDDDGDLAPRDDAVVTGYVDDLADEFAAADVFVVPLREGSGTRLKILEAFARGVPVVSTAVGCDGLEVTDGVHLLVADDAPGFARACCALLTDEPLRERTAQAADALVRERYDWEQIRAAATARWQRLLLDPRPRP